jgi:hypothetical protein
MTDTRVWGRTPAVIRSSGSHRLRHFVVPNALNQMVTATSDRRCDSRELKKLMADSWPGQPGRFAAHGSSAGPQLQIIIPTPNFLHFMHLGTQAAQSTDEHGCCQQHNIQLQTALPTGSFASNAKHSAVPFQGVCRHTLQGLQQ